MKQKEVETGVVVRTEANLAVNKTDGFNFDFGYDRMEKTMALCTSIAQSGMVPRGYENAPRKILVAAAMGARFGLDPLQSLQSIGVVNGNPSFYGDAQLGIVKNTNQEEWTLEGVKAMEYAEKESGIFKKWLEHYEYKPSKIAFCVTKRVGKEPVIQHYTIDQARDGGLLTKDNWKKNVVRMLQMRARSFALRDAYPDLLKGYKTYEEMQDVEVAHDETYIAPMPESTGEFVDAAEWVDEIDERETEVVIEPAALEPQADIDTLEIVSKEELDKEKEEMKPERPITSMDMNAQDAIEDIERLETLTKLNEFVDEDESRKTVLEAYNKKKISLTFEEGMEEKDAPIPAPRSSMFDDTGFGGVSNDNNNDDPF